MTEHLFFGAQPLKLSRLGYGAGQLGGDHLTQNDVDRLLDQLRDAGINLIDTARGYGASEERLGKYLKKHPEAFHISTKVGYGIPGYEDWTHDVILAGIETALKTLSCETLDIVHLHSCPRHVLERGDVIEALLKAKASGKIRVAAYSGENEDLVWAARSGYFDSLQCSVNLCDQWSLQQLLPHAVAAGFGIIAKRSLANAFWRFQKQPTGDYSEAYWLRWQAMRPYLEHVKPEEVALRFSAFAPEVHVAITGTTNPKHLTRNLEAFNKGPLPESLQRDIRIAFARAEQDWGGEL